MACFIFVFSDVRPFSHRSLLVRRSGAVLGAGGAWVAGALAPGSVAGVLAPDRVAGAGPVRAAEIRKAATIATPVAAARNRFLRQRIRPGGFARSPGTGCRAAGAGGMAWPAAGGSAPAGGAAGGSAAACWGGQAGWGIAAG